MKNIILLLAILIAFGGCSSDDDSSSCGCGEERQISDLTGTIYFVDENSFGDFYKNTFRIQSPTNCSGVCNYYILCNEISPQFAELKNDPNNSLTVNFSGTSYSACEDVGIQPADYSFYRIKVDKINIVK